MNQQEKRIKIAEVCGWSDIHERGNRILGTCSKPEWREDSPIPDYFNDLNACHEAEICLLKTAKLEEEYYFGIDRNPFATAQQRAEALGKTLGLW